MATMDLIPFERISPTARRKEAQAAVAFSLRQLDEILANGAEVTRVTTSLRTLREHNRYGERIALSMIPKGPS